VTTISARELSNVQLSTGHSNGQFSPLIWPIGQALEIFIFEDSTLLVTMSHIPAFTTDLNNPKYTSNELIIGMLTQ
jgi:hypothetical protein